MIKFIKDAFTELEHIVWPTPNESRKYMLYTIGTIVVIGLFLAAAGYTLRSSLTFTRAQFPHENIAGTTTSGEEAVTEQELESILDKVKVDEQPSTAPTSIAPDTIQSGSAQ